jgi:hypothetical protein
VPVVSQMVAARGADAWRQPVDLISLGPLAMVFWSGWLADLERSRRVESYLFDRAVCALNHDTSKQLAAPI